MAKKKLYSITSTTIRGIVDKINENEIQKEQILDIIQRESGTVIVLYYD